MMPPMQHLLGLVAAVCVQIDIFSTALAALTVCDRMTVLVGQTPLASDQTFQLLVSCLIWLAAYPDISH